MALNVQSNPLTGPSPLRDIVRPQFHQNNFDQELFIKNDLGLKLDKGMHLASVIPRTVCG